MSKIQNFQFLKKYFEDPNFYNAAHRSSLLRDIGKNNGKIDGDMNFPLFSRLFLALKHFRKTDLAQKLKYILKKVIE